MGTFYVLKYTLKFHEPSYNPIAISLPLFVIACPIFFAERGISISCSS